MKLTRKKLRQLINESLKLSFKPQATENEKDQMKQVLSDLLGLDNIDYHIEDIEYAVLPHKDTEVDHDQYYTKFTNELDNEIELSIEPFDCGSAGQLTITMRGPNSEMSNTITREEAVQLNEMLTRYLAEETSRDPHDQDNNGIPDQLENQSGKMFSIDQDDDYIPDEIDPSFRR